MRAPVFNSFESNESLINVQNFSFKSSGVSNLRMFVCRIVESEQISKKFEHVYKILQLQQLA